MRKDMLMIFELVISKVKNIQLNTFMVLVSTNGKLCLLTYYCDIKLLKQQIQVAF